MGSEFQRKPHCFEAPTTVPPCQYLFAEEARNFVPARAQTLGHIVHHVRNAAFALFRRWRGDQNLHLRRSWLSCDHKELEGERAKQAAKGARTFQSRNWNRIEAGHK